MLFSVAVKRPCVAIILAFFGLVPFLAGCGRGNRLNRLPIHGSVTVGGGEELNGSISFLPSGKTPGPSANAAVVKGHYQFDQDNGPTAGPHDVIARRVIRREDQLAAIAKKQPATQTQNQWKRSADLADDGAYQYDFSLKD